MKKFAFILLVAAFASISARAQSASADNDDFQIWHETQITFPVLKSKDAAGKSTEKLNFFLTGVLRGGRNASDFVDERIGAGFDYKFNRNVSFTPSYLYVASQPSRGSKQFESRVRLALTLENKWKRFSLRDRNLLELRFRNNASNSARYRNRLTFQYPIVKKNKEVFAPYAANEIYYDLTDRRFSRNEVSFGISRKISASVGTEFFYLLRVNRNASLRYVHVAGFNLKIKVDNLFRSEEPAGNRAQNFAPAFP